MDQVIGQALVMFEKLNAVRTERFVIAEEKLLLRPTGKEAVSGIAQPA